MNKNILAIVFGFILIAQISTKLGNKGAGCITNCGVVAAAPVTANSSSTAIGTSSATNTGPGVAVSTNQVNSGSNALASNAGGWGGNGATSANSNSVGIGASDANNVGPG